MGNRARRAGKSPAERQSERGKTVFFFVFHGVD